MPSNLILFGSTLGDTERIAGRLAKLLPGETRLASVATFRMASLMDFDRILLGTSTWGAGDLQDDWESAVGQLRGLDLTGKTVALFGLGDASGYPDTFVDGLGILHEAVSKAGAVRVGYWPTDGYAFDASRAVVEGRFAGLVLDEASQSHLTEERLGRWVREL
ncbi:flavodoxin [Holophaga foetida]|uniref:flavodoxin n=1 Tax=Holophaga foetida TaxID=35839 RepID=UPI0002472F54|nr:flavodoxin [Holophaga foetida]